MKINILDQSVYNLISAGEVVERPSSVVKELVENSLDAGATRITVEVEGGGKRKIRVADDGAGIESEYVLTAYLPHATSKISKADDLYTISTLGFRGEALASIAAVSSVSMVTKTDSADAASLVELQGGKVVSNTFSSGNRGTIITVENLFYNTPARLKFLKRDKTEESYITSLMSNLILANPFISFTYICDGKTVYKSEGKGLENALHSVYNREIAMNLFAIENTSGNFRLNGYISNPTYSKSNRTYQTLIVNGRTVQNATLTAAIEKAYEGFLMKRAYPLYVLDLVIPFEDFDANVHPAKTEVRFSDNGAIFSFVFSSVRNALNGYRAAKSYDGSGQSENDFEFLQKNYENRSAMERETAADHLQSDSISKKSVESDNISENSTSLDADFSAQKTQNKAENGCISSNLNTNQQFSSIKMPSFTAGRNKLREDSGISYDLLKRQAESAQNRAENDRAEMKNQPSSTFNSAQNTEIQEIIQESLIKLNPEIINFDGKILGQLFETYILIERDDQLYIIDQHAAHERILYDNLSKFEDNYAQNMLIPFVLNVNPREFDFMTLCLEPMCQMGFDIEPFGNLSFKISAVPSALSDMNLQSFFDSILKDLISVPAFRSADILADKLKQYACKSAIKAGDNLSDAQLASMIELFNRAESLPLQCPHGRPTVVRFTKKDLEKWFKRIV